MKWKDRKMFLKVYHTTFAHWGSGEVCGWRTKDNLGVPTPFKIQVLWSNPSRGITWMRLSDLRKTPSL